MENICMNVSILTSFSDSSRDIAMATNFFGKIGEITFIQQLGILIRS